MRSSLIFTVNKIVIIRAKSEVIQIDIKLLKKKQIILR